jgi:hypothetical protein
MTSVTWLEAELSCFESHDCQRPSGLACCSRRAFSACSLGELMRFFDLVAHNFVMVWQSVESDGLAVNALHHLLNPALRVVPSAASDDAER